MQSKVILPRPLDKNHLYVLRFSHFYPPGQVSVLRPSLTFQAAYLPIFTLVFQGCFNLRPTERKHRNSDISASKFLLLRIRYQQAPVLPQT